MTDYTEAQAQADADAIIARLAAEPGLREALIADPRGTLLEAGLREDTVAEIELALAGAEVEGFITEFARNRPGGDPGRVMTIGTSGTSVIFGGVVAISATGQIPGAHGGLGSMGSH